MKQEVISKKKRKSSRFYNCVLRKAQGFQHQKKSITLRAKAPKVENLSVIRIPQAPREQRTQKQTPMSFVPKVAQMLRNLFSRKAA